MGGGPRPTVRSTRGDDQAKTPPAKLDAPPTARRPLGHEITASGSGAPAQITAPPDPDVDDASVADDVDTTAADDTTADDADELVDTAAPFSWSVSDRDPSIVFVPVTSTREDIARELETTTDRFYPVGAMEAMPPSDDVQGIRFYAPGTIPADVMTQIRSKLDALIAGDEQRTIDALGAKSGGWSAAQYVLRWSQYSRFTDAAGTSYFDDYLGALEARTITATHTRWFGADTYTSQSALAELLEQTSGDIHAAVLRARARGTGRVATGDDALSATGQLAPGHVIGRYITGTDTAGVAAQIARVLTDGVDSREEAELRVRNAPFAGSKVMIWDGAVWRGYGILFDASAPSVGTIVPPLVGAPSEDGRFYWYYPSTVWFGAGEHDASGPADQPATTAIEQDLLDSAIGGGTSEGMVALDYGALRLASLDQRVAIFKQVVEVGFDKLELHGYSAAEAVDALSRVLLTAKPPEFAALVHALDQAGVLHRLIETHDIRLAPLGRAFTYQALAASVLAPGAFDEPTVLQQGAKEPGSLDYFLATTKSPTDRDGATTIEFEHGTSRTEWGDTDPWQLRSKQTTRAFAVTDLLSVETVTPTGSSRRFASAFEAALSQGDPRSAVGHESFVSFMDTLLLVQGGLSLARLGSLGMRAMATGSLRVAMRFLGEELAKKEGAAAVRGVVDFALYNSARYAEEHHDELEQSAAGRAFLALLSAATTVIAVRDIGTLVESGAITQLVKAGGAALKDVGTSTANAVRRTMRNFRAAEIAWSRIRAEGLVLETNVGGIAARQLRSPTSFTNAYRLGQAQAAGEELFASLGSPAERELAAGVLGKLEAEAGGFQQRTTATPPSESELAAGHAYKVLARFAKDLNAAKRKALLEAVDALLATRRRTVAELAPFLRGAIDNARAGGDAVAYLGAVGKLAERRLSREAFARLAQNAVGDNPADLVWLSTTKLTDADLGALASDKQTKWKAFRAASRNPTETTIPRANRYARGAGAEAAVRDRASALFPGYRLSGAQIDTAGGSVIDYGLVSTDGLARRRLAEVKGFTSDTWKDSFDEFAPGPGDPHVKLLGPSVLNGKPSEGVRRIRGMLKQLKDAAKVEGYERPILVVTDALSEPQRALLARILADNGVDAEIVKISDDAIKAAAKRLGEAMGWR